MNSNKVIQVQGLTKMFGDFAAVNKITFEVEKGEIFGFLGANGAGKTTAMKMLIGISNPTSGKAKVAGFDVFTHAEDIKKNIGYMSQKFALYDDLTVKENITFFGGIYGLSRKRIKEKSAILIAELGLESVAKTLVGSLPLGWKQKLSFSVSLLHDPKIVFLDEPTGGVDPITTHYMDEAEYCDRVSIMVNGKIEALNTPKKLKEQFKVDNMNDVFLKLARG